MKRALLGLAPLAASFLAPAVALAEGGGEGGHGGEHALPGVTELLSNSELQGAVFNFLVLLLLLMLLGGKSIQTFLSNRRREVEESLAEAARLKAEAEAKQKEYADRLEKLDSELESIRADMVRAGEEERDRIVSEAEEKAARMRRDANFLVEQQLKQLREDLTKEAVEAAVAAAEEVLTQKTNTSDQQRLAKEYLERLTQEGERAKEERA